MVTKEDVRRVMADVDALDLADGAHWALVHEMLGLEYGDVFDIIGTDPAFFGYAPAPPRGKRLPASRQRRIRSHDGRRMDDAVPIASYPGPMTTETAAPLVPHCDPTPTSDGGGWSDSGSSSSDGGSCDAGGGGGE